MLINEGGVVVNMQLLWLRNKKEAQLSWHIRKLRELQPRRQLRL